MSTAVWLMRAFVGSSPKACKLRAYVDNVVVVGRIELVSDGSIELVNEYYKGINTV